jgi:hypothetical protein
MRSKNSWSPVLKALVFFFLVVAVAACGRKTVLSGSSMDRFTSVAGPFTISNMGRELLATEEGDLFLLTFDVAQDANKFTLSTYNLGSSTGSDSKSSGALAAAVKTACADAACTEFAGVFDVSVSGSPKQVSILYHDIDGKIASVYRIENSQFSSATDALPALITGLETSVDP